MIDLRIPDELENEVIALLKQANLAIIYKRDPVKVATVAEVPIKKREKKVLPFNLRKTSGPRKAAIRNGDGPEVA